MKKRQLECSASPLEAITDKVMNASSSLVEYRKRLRSRKALAKYYNNCTAQNLLTLLPCLLCEAIERSFSILKGKHACTETTVSLEAIRTGNLFKGEAAAAVNDVVE